MYIIKIYHKLLTFLKPKQMTLDINGVKITLTQDQLQEIARQTGGIRIIEEINSYEDACKVLSETPETNPSIWKRINTIARAMNFIENGFKVWKPNFKDTNERKYYPIHEMKSSGLVFNASDFRCGFSYGQVAFYKTDKASNLSGTKFLHLYKELQDTY